MKSVLDPSTRNELEKRIFLLNENSQRQWGKMTVYQMIKHCSLWEDMTQGKLTYKRVLIGRIFGRIALRSVLKNDTSLAQNTPTIPQLKITGNGDVESEKTAWLAKVAAYAHFSNAGFIHPFFGKMTVEQTGCFVYKHTDHHLRQFGV